MLDPEVCALHSFSCFKLQPINRLSVFFFFGFTEEDNRDRGKLYKPQTKHEDKLADKSNDYAKMMSSPASSNANKKDSLLKKGGKMQEKKKSNLESFKEELRQ